MPDPDAFATTMSRLGIGKDTRVVCYDQASASNSREHNHANVLTLGAALIGDGLAWQIVQEWLSVEWGGGRHARRVDKITALERAHLRRPGGVT